MTIELGYFFNDICGSTTDSWFGKLFTNVIYTSILVALIILLILFFTYPTKKGTPMYTTFRVVFYIFVAVLLIQAVQQRIIESKIEDKFSSRINKEVLGGIKGGDITNVLDATNKVKIVPKYKEPPTKNGFNDKDLDHEDGGKEPTDEQILAHVLGAAEKYQADDAHATHEENEPAQIKVSGASVEDMLRDLGV